MKQSNINRSQAFYQVYFDGFEDSDIKKYAEVFGIANGTLRCLNSNKFFVPGHYLIGLLRGEKLMNALKDQNFPLLEIKNFSISSSGTKENKLFPDEPVLYLLQERFRTTSGDYNFWVEIHRISDNKIILSGLFNFSGVEAPKFMEL